MSREGYTTISAWTRTMPLIEKYRKRLSRERGLPPGKVVSIAEALHHMAQHAAAGEAR